MRIVSHTPTTNTQYVSKEIYVAGGGGGGGGGISMFNVRGGGGC